MKLLGFIIILMMYGSDAEWSDLYHQQTGFQWSTCCFAFDRRKHPSFVHACRVLGTLSSTNTIPMLGYITTALYVLLSLSERYITTYTSTFSISFICYKLRYCSQIFNQSCYYTTNCCNISVTCRKTCMPNGYVTGDQSVSHSRHPTDTPTITVLCYKCCLFPIFKYILFVYTITCILLDPSPNWQNVKTTTTYCLIAIFLKTKDCQYLT